MRPRCVLLCGLLLAWFGLQCRLTDTAVVRQGPFRGVWCTYSPSKLTGMAYYDTGGRDLVLGGFGGAHADTGYYLGVGLDGVWVQYPDELTALVYPTGVRQTILYLKQKHLVKFR